MIFFFFNVWVILTLSSYVNLDLGCMFDFKDHICLKLIIMVKMLFNLEG